MLQRMREAWDSAPANPALEGAAIRIPGFATPEQYVKEITTANDGIVNQRTVMTYAENSYPMIEELDRWGVKFEKDETGDYAMRKVHHMGTYVLPMPEGHDIKKVLYRRLKRTRVEITNRLVATRLLLADQNIEGLLRTGAVQLTCMVIFAATLWRLRRARSIRVPAWLLCFLVTAAMSAESSE